MTTFLMIALSISMTWASGETLMAKKSVEGLIRPLVLGKQKNRTYRAGDFRIDQCEKHKIKWMDVLLMKTQAQLSFSMKLGCDIEGTIVPKVFTPFPVHMKVRNLQNYTRLEAQNKITASLESKPILLMEVREAVLIGEGKRIKFEADYRAQINPMNKEKPLEKNLGGELRILEIDGKAVSLKENIFIK